ncbi:MAG: hypothetical protein ABIL09_23720, partial [Gemmatimonadota bacterium]
MIIGCLSGSGRGAAIDGTYAFCIPGRVEPLVPDLQADRAAGAGPFAFAGGALTDGDSATQVGWRSGTVGEVGVDVLVDLGSRHFVDRVLLHQPERKGPAARGPSAAAAIAAGDIESIGHVEPAGLSRVEVYAVGADGQGLSLVGHAGERGSATFPEGPVTVWVGLETGELVVRLISYQRDIRLTGLEVWGAAPGEPRVFPVPARMEMQPGPALVLGDRSAIRVGPSAGEDVRFAASLLAGKVHERSGLRLEVTEDPHLPSTHVLSVVPRAAGAPAAGAGTPSAPTRTGA